MPRTPILFFIGFVGLITLFNSLYIVNQTEQALITQFGEIKRVVDTPGLKLKKPFIESVEFFDKRLLDFNAPPIEMITQDRERIVVDAYVKYRISDPKQFFKSVRTEEGLRSRFNNILISSLRQEIGGVTLRLLLSEKRQGTMQAVRDEANRKASREVVAPKSDATTPTAEEVAVERVAASRGFGIEVVDIRILRADLPPEISQSTFKRMQAELAEEAQKFRSQGEEESIKIRSSADRDRTELLAAAQRKSEILRGEGDGMAAKIYADAFNKDADFYDFYRSMQAYKVSLGKSDTTVILSPDSEFLHYLEKR
ncbi:MAG: protease modulator HflC [Rickettsiales bacterium]|nr:protease modulator HflC [Rickettsiales bacterium]